MNRRNQKWPDEMVALVKAARGVGIRGKTIAYLTGVSENTICAWNRGAIRPEIEPDPQFRERLAALFGMCPEQ